MYVMGFSAIRSTFTTKRKSIWWFWLYFLCSFISLPCQQSLIRTSLSTATIIHGYTFTFILDCDLVGAESRAEPFGCPLKLGPHHLPVSLVLSRHSALLCNCQSGHKVSSWFYLRKTPQLCLVHILALRGFILHYLLPYYRILNGLCYRDPGRCLSSHAFGSKRNRPIKGVMWHLVWGMTETISLYRTLLISKLYLAWGLACFLTAITLVYSFLWLFFFKEIHHFWQSCYLFWVTELHLFHSKEKDCLIQRCVPTLGTVPGT